MHAGIATMACASRFAFDRYSSVFKNISLIKMSFVTRSAISALVSRSILPSIGWYASLSLQTQHRMSSNDAATTSTAKSDGQKESPSSIAPDAFLSHLQHKTETDLLELLSQKDKDKASDEAGDHKEASMPYQCIQSEAWNIIMTSLQGCLCKVQGFSCKNPELYSYALQEDLAADGEIGGPKGVYHGAEPTRYGG